MTMRTKQAAAIAAGGFSLALLVRRWDEWLNASHDHNEEHEKADGSGVLTIGSSRPQTADQLVRGAASCLAFLTSVDLLLARRMSDDTSRYFLLHTMANAVISLSSAREMFRVLRDPIGEALGTCNVLPTYMIPCLFIYHLSCFKNVPLEEWQHHLLFGIGLAGPQLRYCVGPVQNAVPGRDSKRGFLMPSLLSSSLLSSSQDEDSISGRKAGLLHVRAAGWRRLCNACGCQGGTAAVVDREDLEFAHPGVVSGAGDHAFGVRDLYCRKVHSCQGRLQRAWDQFAAIAVAITRLVQWPVLYAKGCG